MDDSNPTAIGMSGINENVPSGGHDDRRNSQQGRPSRVDPFVSRPTRPLCLPARHRAIHGFNGNGIRRLNFEIAKADGNILDVNFGVYQDLQ
jgi:hypothetical protein